jgi:hypothetical protein
MTEFATEVEQVGTDLTLDEAQILAHALASIGHWAALERADDQSYFALYRPYKLTPETVSDYEGFLLTEEERDGFAPQTYAEEDG